MTKEKIVLKDSTYKKQSIVHSENSDLVKKKEG